MGHLPFYVDLDYQVLKHHPGQAGKHQLFRSFQILGRLKMPRDSPMRSTGVCHEVSAGAPSDFGVFLLSLDSLVCSKADPLGLALPVHCHSRMDSGGLWLRLPMHRSIGRPVETC